MGIEVAKTDSENIVIASKVITSVSKASSSRPYFLHYISEEIDKYVVL